MNSLKILFFIFIFILNFLSSNGCILRCGGHIYRKPPCTLLISVQKDHFLVRAGNVLPPNIKQQVIFMTRQRSIRGSRRFSMSSMSQPNIDQLTAKKICMAMRIAYRPPTYIRFH